MKSFSPLTMLYLAVINLAGMAVLISSIGELNIPSPWLRAVLCLLASVALILAADCEAADALDAGQLFIANLTVQSAAGSTSVSTTNFGLETGLILIESVEDELMSGEKGDTLLRKICVKNTRIGKIGALHFEDEHLPGFTVSVLNATTQSGDDLLWVADFDGSFFTAAGNGDTWLDLSRLTCW